MLITKIGKSLSVEDSGSLLFGENIQLKCFERTFVHIQTEFFSLFFFFDRSLKLWMVLRLYGAEQLKSYIRNHVKLAQDFEQLVSQDPNFEVTVKISNLSGEIFILARR